MKAAIIGIVLLIVLVALVLCAPVAIDNFYQAENHESIRTLRQKIEIGMDYRSAVALLEDSGGPEEKTVFFEQSNHLQLSTERVVFPHNAWILVVSFDDTETVESIVVRSMDSMSDPPRGAPEDIP